MKYRILVCVGFFVGLSPVWTSSQGVLPPPADKVIDYDRDIKPIIAGHCIDCHGVKKQKSLYRMDSRADAIGSGSEKSAMIPGNSAESLVVILISAIDPGYEPMPPKGDRLTPEQVGLIRAWIDQGVDWSDPVDPAAARTAGVPFNGLGGAWRMATSIPDTVPLSWERAAASGPVGEVCLNPPAPDQKAAGHGNLIWDRDAGFQQGTLSARLIPVDRPGALGGGLVWQVEDGQNYLLALYRDQQRQLALYSVEDGAMNTLAEAELPVMEGGWLDLEVTQARERVTVRADGVARIDVAVPAASEPGGVGLFAPADAAARITVPRITPE